LQVHSISGAKMNVFILNTGRCGSTTFVKACEHITNFTAAHESRMHLVGKDRLAYPENHIEADNRLAWFLGRMEKTYGDNAIYVHLTRDTLKTARSFEKRYNFGIIEAYKEAVLYGCAETTAPIDVCLDYCDTINSNIEAFLVNKTHKMNFALENAIEDFKTFWQLIGAEGDLDAAIQEWEVPYNASSRHQELIPSWPERLSRKAMRAARELPTFLKNV
jgi:hypothetical protein